MEELKVNKNDEEMKVLLDGDYQGGQDGFKKMIEGYKHLNEKTSKYTYLLMFLVVGYEFLQNRISSNRVDKLQGTVDNLYKQVNEMKNGNKALEKK